jgi:hypothetical protein
MQQWSDPYVRASLPTELDHTAMLRQETFAFMAMTAIDETPYLGTDEIAYGLPVATAILTICMERHVLRLDRIRDIAASMIDSCVH